MIILGINAYHADSSACLIKDGEIIAAVEEERFTRDKHWAGFPTNSIVFCLNQANLTIYDIDFITTAKDPKAKLQPKNYKLKLFGLAAKIFKIKKKM